MEKLRKQIEIEDLFRNPYFRKLLMEFIDDYKHMRSSTDAVMNKKWNHYGE